MNDQVSTSIRAEVMIFILLSSMLASTSLAGSPIAVAMHLHQPQLGIVTFEMLREMDAASDLKYGVTIADSTLGITKRDVGATTGVTALGSLSDRYIKV